MTTQPDMADHGDATAHAITCVWSSYGHTFLDDGGAESCLICGALYELIPDDPSDPSHGRYCAANGDDPMPCTGDTAMSHGYPGERLDGTVEHACNCVRCA